MAQSEDEKEGIISLFQIGSEFTKKIINKLHINCKCKVLLDILWEENWGLKRLKKLSLFYFVFSGGRKSVRRLYKILNKENFCI